MTERHHLQTWFGRLPALGAILLVAFAFTPTAGADTEVYLIQVTDLVEMDLECGPGSRYSCAADAQPGFQFTDVLPAGSTVNSVIIEFNHGIQCTDSTYVFQTQFNGGSAGAFTSENWCSCDHRRNIMTFDVPASAYVVRGVNSFLITNPESCQGLVPDSDLGEAYAMVTVDFTPGTGGGGGECDLGPVLARLDEMEAGLHSAHEATALQVIGEHGITREVLLDQHEATRHHTTVEHEVTRNFVADTLLRLMVEQDLSKGLGNDEGLMASTCLPEEHGGHLDLAISIVFDTIEAHAAAGCNVTAAEANFDKGAAKLADGSFSRACTWFHKAYLNAGQACP